MRHVIDLPEEIEQVLEKRASEAGGSVTRLIEAAVAAFVRNGAQGSSRRKPDALLEAAETVAPCDLPRSTPHLITIGKNSRRMPDPLTLPIVPSCAGSVNELVAIEHLDVIRIGKRVPVTLPPHGPSRGALARGR